MPYATDMQDGSWLHMVAKFMMKLVSLHFKILSLSIYHAVS